MRRWLFFTIISIVSFFTINYNVASAQQRFIDSIRHELAKHSTDDTTKARLLLAIANKFYYVNADSQRVLAQQALGISEKLNDKHGIVMSMEAIASSLFQKGTYQKAISQGQYALAVSRRYNIGYQNAMLYNNIANSYYRLNKYNEALEYYDSAALAVDAHPNKEMRAKVHSNIANVYYSMGDYTKALKYYLEGLYVQEQLGVATNIASDLSNISNVYFRLGDYARARKYNTRGLELNKKAGARINIIGNLTTYAMIYDAEKKYDSSLLRLNEALAIAQEQQNAFMQNLLKGNIAECYLKMGEYEQAYGLYLESVSMSEKLGDVEGLAIAKAGVGQTLIKQGAADKGIPYMQAALQLMQENELREQGMDVAEKLANAFEQKGDYRKALQYYKISDAYKDSLSKGKARREVQQVMFNYELQKKEARISLLEKDNAIRQSRNRMQRILLSAALAGLILAVLAAYLFFRNVRNVKKSRELILQQKQEIEQQAERLQELNEFKDSAFSVLSHDLRSPVNALASTMMLLDEKLMTPEEFAMHKQELNNKLQSVSLLLENLLYWSQNQMKGKQAPDVQKLYIQLKVLRTIAIVKDAAQQKKITLQSEVGDGIYAYGDKNHLEIALRNVMTNAIKFTPVGGTITITAQTDNNVTRVSVTDNGVGMTPEQISKLFSGNSNISTSGTSGEKGTGLGLRLSYEFMQLNGGTILVSSEPGKGSTFTLVLPAVPGGHA